MTASSRKMPLVIGLVTLALSFGYRAMVNGHLGPNNYIEWQQTR